MNTISERYARRTRKGKQSTSTKLIGSGIIRGRLFLASEPIFFLSFYCAVSVYDYVALPGPLCPGAKKSDLRQYFPLIY